MMLVRIVRRASTSNFTSMRALPTCASTSVLRRLYWGASVLLFSRDIELQLSYQTCKSVFNLQFNIRSWESLAEEGLLQPRLLETASHYPPSCPTTCVFLVLRLISLAKISCL